MSSVQQGNRFAPPEAHVEDVAIEGTLELAGRGARLVAVVADGIATGAAVWLCIWLVFPRMTELLRTGAMSFLAWFGYMFVIGLACYLALHGITIARRGQTLGKLLLGIRIVRGDGSRASFLRIVVLRHLPTSVIGAVPLLGAVYVLADSLLIFRESRKCLHDNIADTLVVKAVPAE